MEGEKTDEKNLSNSFLGKKNIIILIVIALQVLIHSDFKSVKKKMKLFLNISILLIILKSMKNFPKLIHLVLMKLKIQNY